MNRKEFVMRGQTASGKTEVLNFTKGGMAKGYAYRMTQFQIYPSTNLPGADSEITGTVTAAKVAETPTDPNFNNEGLIACSYMRHQQDVQYPISAITVVNDTFLITQNLILMVQESASSGAPVNWQCRFVMEKMTAPEEAVTNYKQFTISDAD